MAVSWRVDFLSKLHPGRDVNSPEPDHRWSAALPAWVEIALIFILFFVLAGTPPPDVNEAHYVAKAKHYWNPEWCRNDHFLNSADAHLVFYWSFGWLTKFFALPTVTWIGRVVTWLLLAWSWRRMSLAIVPSPLFSLLTAALFAGLMRWGHMAGEWVIGGLEAKGFAYVLIWLAIEAILRARWRTAIVYLGGASAFHVIAGGWSLVMTAIAWVATTREQRPRIRTLLPSLIVAAGLALFGLVPGLTLSTAAPAEVVHEANRINVFERLSHHLLFHELPHIFIARHAALLVAWLGLAYRLKGKWENSEPAVRLKTLNKIVLGAAVIALTGIVLDQSLLYFRMIAASVLRFYWFRLSDVMLPVGVTFGWAVWLYQLKTQRSSQYSWMLSATLVVLCANVSHVVYEHLNDPRPGAVSQSMPAEALDSEQRMARFAEWTQVCSWIQDNTPADAVFLTPRHQQTFQWYAGRSEVVSAKNFPQDAIGIVQWRQRMEDVFPRDIEQADLSAHGEEGLIKLAEKYSFQYVVLDRAVSRRSLKFERLYPEKMAGTTYYEVFQMPSRD
jgi:hypothetical protein